MEPLLVPSASATAISNDELLDLTARSTRGASKQRRDHINIEIQALRDLLPLNSCVKDRLFQLQVMSMACIYIRKQRYLPHVLQTCQKPIYPLPYSLCTPRGVDIHKALRGFMLVCTQQGKLLHLSENASDYLGYSVEEIMCQGDSLYDLVDSRDFHLVKSHLDDDENDEDADDDDDDKTAMTRDRVFLCRMNVSRTAKRQMQNYKYVVVEGRYIHPSDYYRSVNARTGGGTYATIHPIFAAFCTPLLGPDNMDTVIAGHTDIFTSTHTADLRFVDIDTTGVEWLGCDASDLCGSSLYSLVHPAQVFALADCHQHLNQRGGDNNSIACLTRMQSAHGGWLWLHSVFARMTDASTSSEDDESLLIHAVHQVLSDSLALSLLECPSLYTDQRATSGGGREDGDQHVESPATSDIDGVDFETAHLLSRQFKAARCAVQNTTNTSLDPNNNNNAEMSFGHSSFGHETASNNNERIKYELPSEYPHLLTTPPFVQPTTSSIDQLLFATEVVNGGGTLPELDGDHLDEYFRLMEETTSSVSLSSGSLDRSESDMSTTRRAVKREALEASLAWLPEMAIHPFDTPIDSHDDHNGNLLLDSVNTQCSRKRQCRYIFTPSVSSSHAAAM